jgi:tetratricopeptide (TPR) repeat protein
MKIPVGTTFIVAASLLGAAAVAQLVAILIYFGPNFTQGRSDAASVTAEPAPVAEATPEPAAVNPEEDLAVIQARLEELTKEADMLEGGSSPGSALAPLEEALTLQPRNPELLRRVASLHEKLGQMELAESAWKSLVDLGPEAGKLLDLAEIRLRLLRPETATPAAGMELRDQVGLQPGSSLGVVDLQVKESADSGTKDLRLAVKARPGETIDGRDVRINVTFYEMMAGEVVPTTSRVQSMWFTTPVDWNDEGIEILEVKYEVPRVGPDGGPAPEYYGYMVNIYHRGQLQETRADPVDLQELYPPPLSELPDYDGAGDAGAAP